MSGGGIIIQRAKALLIAITDESLYDSLDPKTKAQVDAIDAKGPDQRTKADVLILARAIMEAATT
jgi:hypothetical protein